MNIDSSSSIITNNISKNCLALPIGMLSDRIGRRPVVLLGLAVGILSSLSFGLSKTYQWALCTKILSGLLVSIYIYKLLKYCLTCLHTKLNH